MGEAYGRMGGLTSGLSRTQRAASGTTSLPAPRPGPSPAADTSAAAAPAPRAAAPALRAHGKTPYDRARLTSVPRGQEVFVKLVAEHRATDTRSRTSAAPAGRLAIAQGVITGELISSSVTNASTLVAGFLRRCAEAGVFFIAEHGLELGMLRSINQNRAAPAAYAAQHGLHGTLTLLDVGN